MSSCNQSVAGFTDLKQYDSNSDNLINSQDTQFNLLRLWNDANANGTVEAGELTTLAANNITEISLNKYSNQKIIEGNLQTAISTVTMNGAARNIHELSFAFIIPRLARGSEAKYRNAANDNSLTNDNKLIDSNFIPVKVA